ncbi:e18ce618-6174-4b91-80f6-1fd9d716c873 [Sclerotinia trifoliorum]|uniref:E18ce618-6174-4b91-80f6-1fd9d716c873 n=1 Tax=Sclerotinia trifoliorum TaxID=28548 RepID=A0A8H2VQK5_9HELO|nr:e18ce618-6174-4b91-80f6-1fd9d716c873 [Sclerotinia trifoliorum]
MADEVDVKPRKSVAFSDGTTIVDENGEVTMKEDGHDDTKETAQSHSPSNGDEATANNEDDGLGDLSLMKKKKKKSKKVDEGEEGGDEAAADGGLDLSTMKKKKKSSKKPKDGEDDFTARLAAANLNDDGEKAAEETPVDEGDMMKGTGIWAHDETKLIPYEQLLSRFFTLLAQKNPDHASSGSKSYKIPPPQCLREGNKKTIFANIAEICKRMKRTDEHVTQYLFAELGTNGSVDGSRRLVIKGRFQQKQIENVLRKYIMEYVTCKTCRSPDTELNKGENRLFFITCNSCGSRRSVTAIKTGFSAQVGKRRRQQG